MRFLSFYVSLFHAIVETYRDRHVQALLLVSWLIATGAALVFTRLEGWRFLDAFYFAVVSMATVGYGDLSPQTALGKIFAMVFLVIGIGVFVLTVTTIAQTILHELFVSESSRTRRTKSNSGPD